ncbi:MAG: hypothetical protein HKO59_01740 [Phycisphaerales bacterium]|nr:hypothetical protein [Phycisphaerae bacterium]NNM24704.1 hypothetical protein [Phycisphaerales bacterium]
MPPTSRAVLRSCFLLTMLTVGSASAGDGCTPAWDTTLGVTGMNDLVAAFEVYDDGSGGGDELYATGSFTTAGAAGTRQLAKWSGTGWTSVGGGLQGGFSSTLAVFDGALYAAGYHDLAGGVAGTAKIARWDGVAWTGLDAQLELFSNSIWGLEVYDDGTGPALYVAGNYADVGGTTFDFITRWDGSTWSDVGGSGLGGAGIPLIAIAMEVFDDGRGPALYVGGRFGSIGGVAASHIGRWDGTTWEPLGSGLSGAGAGTGAHAMAVYDDGRGPALYVGGQSFTTAGGVAVSRIARWDGTSWSAVGDGFNSTVWDLRVFDDGSGPALYAMGLFTMSGATPVNRIARWRGDAWEAVGVGVNEDIFGAVVYEDDGVPTLVVGGDFTAAGGLATNRVAQYTGCVAACPQDLDGTGDVGFTDLISVLAAWGPCVGCPQDFDGTGDVGFTDLLTVLAAWGPCP